jgi:hypothetical protein
VPFIEITSTIRPAALAAGATQNYAPAGLATSGRAMLTSDAAGSTLGGMVGNQVDGAEVILTNIAGGLLTIAHQAAGSAPGNKFTCPNSVDMVLRIGGSVICQYDGTALCWRPVAEAFGGYPYLKALYVEGAVQLDAITRLWQVRIDGYIQRGSAISPAALAAGQTDNYDISVPMAGANRIRQATDAANSALGGLVPIGLGGAEWILLNLGPGTLTLKHLAGGSAAANQFQLAGAVDRVIAANGAVLISYDATLSKWIVVG